jgi:hypothetical protein
MKKIIALAIGLGIVLGTVSASFAQDDKKTSDTTKKKAKKAKKTDATKTDK